MACTSLDGLIISRIVPTLIVQVLRGELRRCFGFRFGNLVISLNLLFQLVLLGLQHHDLGFQLLNLFFRFALLARCHLLSNRSVNVRHFHLFDGSVQDCPRG